MADDTSWVKDGGKLGTEEVRRHYDDWAATYDEAIADWDYRAPQTAAGMLRPLTAPDAALFDAGCGTGLSGQALRDAGFTGRLDGGDLSGESVKIAQGRGSYDAVQVIDFNALPLPLDTDAYGATVCIGVLTYVQDLTALLREFCRITRPGGHVLVTHREDLVRSQDFPALTDRLAEQGLWRRLELTEPQPYLPGNPDFGDEIGVVYGLFEVR
jgi:predicted TPR repeat methyltransferase